MPVGKLYIVSAPSGAGKTSLLKALNERLPNIRTSISHTTRHPRPGEVNGKDYYFVDAKTFQAMIDEGEFLEYASVFDHFYGTSKQAVNQQLECGDDVILEIDWQGARLVRQSYPAVSSIFILPPSIAALEQRLRQRGQDEEETIQRRMRDAAADILHYQEYDYCIINDEFEQALALLEAIFVNPAQFRSPESSSLDSLLHEVSKHVS